jgi:hypothetical protein
MAAVPGILRRWNPGILPGINVWLDSSDRATINSNPNGTVNSIIDKTANNTVLTQPNTPNKPSVGVDSGGRNILSFGTDLFLQTNNFPFNGPTSNFINVNVFTVDNYAIGEENFLYYLTNSSNDNLQLSITEGSIEVSSSLFTSGNLQLDKKTSNTYLSKIIYNVPSDATFNIFNIGDAGDPDFQTTTNGNLNYQTSMSNFTLGRTFDLTETTPTLFKGSISEMVFYNKRNTNLEPLEGYLAWKWGLQGYLSNTHPYKYRPPS